MNLGRLKNPTMNIDEHNDEPWSSEKLNDEHRWTQRWTLDARKTPRWTVDEHNDEPWACFSLFKRWTSEKPENATMNLRRFWWTTMNNDEPNDERAKRWTKRWTLAKNQRWTLGVFSNNVEHRWTTLNQRWTSLNLRSRYWRKCWKTPKMLNKIQLGLPKFHSPDKLRFNIFCHARLVQIYIYCNTGLSRQHKWELHNATFVGNARELMLWLALYQVLF